MIEEVPWHRETMGSVLLRFRDKAPVDVDDLALALGLRVWYSPALSPDISGKIVRDTRRGGRNGYAIFVNANEGRRRRRFTVAHVIAHYVLHGDRIGDELIDDAMYRSGLPSAHETEANRLAADILMPPSLVRELYEQGLQDAAALAKRFDVSEKAMTIRLEQMRLTPYSGAPLAGEAAPAP